MIRQLLFIFVVFFANIVEGITGFAGTMLAMPPSMMLIGIGEAKVILNMAALLVSSTIAVKTYRDIDRRELGKIAVLMTVGMGAGLYLYSVLPLSGLSRIYGILILAVAVKGLFFKKQADMPKAALIAVLLCAGIIHGMFLSGGALLVVYALAVLKKKEVIRATLAPVWLILNSMILVQDMMAGHITPAAARLAAGCVIPVILALVLGNYLHKKMKQEFFVKLTYVLLVVSGITLLVS